MTDFRRLLLDLVQKYGGTKQALAREVGITPSALSHLLAKGHTGSHASTELCLRLAAATGVSASKILRAAGKPHVADLLENLYGEAAERRQRFHEGIRLSPHEARHLTAVRALAPRTQRAFFVIVESAATGRPTAAALRAVSNE